MRLNTFSMTDTQVRPVFPLFWRLINEPFEKCTFECVLGATVSTRTRTARLFTPALQKQQSADASQTFSLLLFFFHLVFISNQAARAFDLRIATITLIIPAVLMWDRALSSLFILPFPSALFRRGGIDESAATL